MATSREVTAPKHRHATRDVDPATLRDLLEHPPRGQVRRRAGCARERAHERREVAPARSLPCAGRARLRSRGSGRGGVRAPSVTGVPDAGLAARQAAVVPARAVDDAVGRSLHDDHRASLAAGDLSNLAPASSRSEQPEQDRDDEYDRDGAEQCQVGLDIRRQEEMHRPHVVHPLSGIHRRRIRAGWIARADAWALPPTGKSTGLEMQKCERRPRRHERDACRTSGSGDGLRANARTGMRRES